MKDTLDNKATFFALYWGQMRAYNDELNLRHVDERYVINDTVRHPERLETAYFLLNPISRLKDEDALWLGRDANEFVSSYEDDLKYCKELVDRMSNKPHLINQKQGDYIRSKGYALPWLDTTVEQQIEFGWVRLKQKR